jgi:HlyD family secretion protein
MTMNTELQSLRISKEQKARRDDRPAWPWVLLVLLAGGTAVGAWRWRAAAAVPVVETLRVRLPEAGAASAAADGDGDIEVLTATGYIMAAHRIELASKVIGRVSWVGVEMGDKVKKGQVLVRLEDDEYKVRVAQQEGLLAATKARLAELEAGPRAQEIAQAQAQYERAKVDYEKAARNFRRLQDVRSARSVSQNEIDDAESLMKAEAAQTEAARQQYELLKAGTRKEQVAAQQATVQQLEAALAQTMVDLNNTVIKAPVDSTILERNVEVGEFVTTGFVGDRGAKGYVVSIADLDDLLVELDISQNDFSKVADNQPCRVTTDTYPDVKYGGRVDLIAPVANRQKATVQVRVKILNPDGRLKPDMNATVSFLAPQKAGGAGGPGGGGAADGRPAVRVPAGAVQAGGAVFVVDGGRAARRAVKVGRKISGGQVEILDGLQGGEDLIPAPPEGLKDGDPVTPAPARP